MEEQKPKSAGRWKAALKTNDRKRKEWEERGKKIVDRYRDERPEIDSSKQLNILWSNVETLKPAIYSRTPKPVVKRRFLDKDPISRAASEILERSLSYSLDNYDFDGVIKSVVEDFLLPGRGLVKSAYKPYMEKRSGLNEAGEQIEYDEVVYEEAECKYHFWQDVRHGEGRTWDDVPWVAFREYLTRDELVERYGKQGQLIPLDYKAEDVDEENADYFKKAIIWEIWDKKGKKTVWIAEGYENIIEEGPAPLNLHGFFPTPKPLYSLVTNGNLIPVPEYCQYQDQADELDKLTARISTLLDAVKVAGFYAGDKEDTLSQIFNSSCNNELIPVDSWAMWAEKGGVKGLIDWYPVETVVNVIRELYAAREQTKQELYEITGISDIIRGSSDSRETATAQQIKGQFATLRLSDKQDEVQRFIRDLIRIKAEIICEHFSLNTLKIMTGLEYDEQMWESAYNLLKTDALRTFKISIETDSTIKGDEQADKQSRIEFLEASTNFIKQAGEVGAQQPDMVPLLGEMLMFGVRGFRTGRELEESFEQVLDTLKQQAAQPPKPDPQQQLEAAEKQQEMEHAERDQKREDAKLQLDAREIEIKANQDMVRANANL